MIVVDWNALRDADPSARAKACNDLAEQCWEAIRPNGWPPRAPLEVQQAWAMMLGDPDESVRDAAEACLLDLSDKGTYAILIENLKAPDPNLRFGTAHALARFGRHPMTEFGDATPELTKLLSDPAERTQVTAAWALAALHEENLKALAVLTAGLRSKDAAVVGSALKGISRYVERGTRSTDFVVKHRPADLTPALLHLLNQQSGEFRRSTAGILGECGDRTESVYKGLAAALDDPDHAVREYAAFAFSQLQFPNPPGKVFEILCAYLDEDHGGFDRRLGIWALARLNQFPPCVVKALTKHLNDPVPEDRFEAACLLSRHPGEESARIELLLLELLSTDRERLSAKRAIEALGRLGLKTLQARQFVERATLDPDQEVQAVANQVWKKLNKSAPREDCAEPKQQFPRATHGLGGRRAA